MDFTQLLIITTTLSVVGCTTQSASGRQMKETKECMQYRSMMTVPMPPTVIDILKEKCEQSKLLGKTTR